MSTGTDRESPRCPSCGQPLAPEGELLRCAEHGQFFSYGPRLLVKAALPRPERAPMSPNQTVRERALG